MYVFHICADLTGGRWKEETFSAPGIEISMEEIN